MGTTQKKNGGKWARLTALLVVLLMTTAQMKAQTILNVSYVDVDGTTKTQDCTPITDSMTGTWNEGWYVVNSGVTMTEANVKCSGAVNLIFADGHTLSVDGKIGAAGINVSGSNSLTIYGQSGGTGTLNAIGGNYAVGIGGWYDESGNNITINGGTVNAKGAHECDGIGSGFDGSASSNIHVSANCTLKVGTDANMDEVISHTSGENLATELAGMTYVKVGLETFVVTNETELDNALVNVASGDIIQLGADISITKCLSIASKNFALDLNGYALKQNNTKDCVINNGGTLTIDDHSTTAKHYYTVNADGLWVWDDNNTAGAVNFEDLTERPAENSVVCINCGAITGGNIGVKNTGTLSFNGGTICDPLYVAAEFTIMNTAL